jgi:RNA polymerase-interacting CarD/CdnL/TRCF family regulator
MYKVDDVVVFRRDVCRVVGKEISDMTGEECYILEPYHKVEGSVVMKVPVSNKAGNLRDVMTKKDVDNLIQRFSTIDALLDKPANMKSQYVSLLKGNNVDDLLKIMKTSFMRNQARLENKKKAASVDGEYLMKAEKYLFNEMSVALDMSFEDTKKYFMNGINQ